MARGVGEGWASLGAAGSKAGEASTAEGKQDLGGHLTGQENEVSLEKIICCESIDRTRIQLVNTPKKEERDRENFWGEAIAMAEPWSNQG